MCHLRRKSECVGENPVKKVETDKSVLDDRNKVAAVARSDLCSEDSVISGNARLDVNRTVMVTCGSHYCIYLALDIFQDARAYRGGPSCRKRNEVMRRGVEQRIARVTLYELAIFYVAISVELGTVNVTYLASD